MNSSPVEELLDLNIFSIYSNPKWLIEGRNCKFQIYVVRNEFFFKSPLKRKFVSI